MLYAFGTACVQIIKATIFFVVAFLYAHGLVYKYRLQLIFIN